MPLAQLTFLTLECVVAAAVVLGLVRARKWIGLGPLYVAIGSWQFLQSLLANSFYVPLWGELSVSPGSTALFSCTLFAVLVLYVRFGVREARELMVGVIVANLSITLWSLVLGWHLGRPETVNLLGVPESIFALNARFALVGTAVTALDVVLVTVVWEVLGRMTPTALVTRAVATLGVVLAADTLLFATGAFGGSELWLPILVSGLVGKSWCALVYGIILGSWLRAEGVHYARVAQHGPVHGVFAEVLDLREMGNFRDGETGLYDVDFFWDVAQAEMDKARRADREVAFVLFDIDHFRTYGRTHGPEAKRRVLRAVATVVGEQAGHHDFAFRFAPDQFALLLHTGGRAAGHASAKAVQRRLAAAVASAMPRIPGSPTVTAGVAASTSEPGEVRDLVFEAESRVHEGKVAGRNAVVDGESS